MEKILKSWILAIVKNENDNDATCVKVLVNSNLRLESLPDEKGHFYVIEWSGDENGKNHFVTSIGERHELDIYKKNLEVLEEI